MKIFSSQLLIHLEKSGEILTSKSTLETIKEETMNNFTKIKKEILEGQSLLENIAVYLGISEEQKEKIVKESQEQARNVNVQQGGQNQVETLQQRRVIVDFASLKNGLNSTQNISEKIDIRYINFRFIQSENFQRGNDPYVQIKPTLEERTLEGKIL